jgi:predicted TIM-barrel fold metal-dependent hydrolase
MIDPHQHLLDPSRFNSSWAAALPKLQGNFGVREYRIAAQNCGIADTISMEVDADEGQSADEAKAFCALAAAGRGVSCIECRHQGTRCLWGGDWPVVDLGSGLQRWCKMTRELRGSLYLRKQSSIFSDNARRIYHLNP